MFAIDLVTIKNHKSPVA